MDQKEIAAATERHKQWYDALTADQQLKYRLARKVSGALGLQSFDDDAGLVSKESMAHRLLASIGGSKWATQMIADPEFRQFAGMMDK